MNFTSVGLQRSGTNYVQSFFEKQGFKHISRSPGNLFDYPFYAWKHWLDPNRFVKDVGHYHLTIMVSKHPLKWLESILRTPADISFVYPHVQYGKNRVPCPHSWRLQKFTHLSVDALLEHYNTFHHNWLNTKLLNNYYTVRYEDMIDIDGVNDFVQSICYDLNIPYTKISARPENLEMSSGERSKKYLEAYKKGQHNLPESFVDVAREKVSSSVLERLGYQL